MNILQRSWRKYTAAVCGLFWMVYLITAAPLTNGWTENVFMKIRRAMKRALILRRTVRTILFLNLRRAHSGRTMRNMTAGWGHNTLPKLNYEESEQVEEYILRIGKKWVSEPYNVDGWRLDVAADLGLFQRV